jgi:exosortase/archaeosortase family protein
MTKSFFHSFKVFFTEPQWEKVRGVFWFCLITLVFHILWRTWANTFHFAPIQPFISSIRMFLVNRLYNESVYILRNILNITITTQPGIIITKNGLWLLFGGSAAGLKQMCQFAILILLFSGHWKRKAWFIPVGIIILHLTNIFRIICLVIIAMHWPQQINYAHDNWLRLLYYIVIFGLWVVWTEKIAINKQGVLTKNQKLFAPGFMEYYIIECFKKVFNVSQYCILLIFQ